MTQAQTKGADWTERRINVAPLGFVVILAAGWYFGLIRPDQFQSPLTNAMLGVLLGCALLAGLRLLDVLVDDDDDLADEASDDADESAWDVVQGLLAGPLEEGVFRGVFQSVLQTYVPAPLAILLPNVVFGLGHRNHWLTVLLTGSFGCALGTAFWYSGSLVLVAVAHSTVNATMSLLQYYDDATQDSDDEKA